MKIIVFALLFLVASPALAADQKETTYDRVMRTGTLRCGYGVWDPIFMKDPNTGALSGVFYDYTMALSKALHLKVEWAEETDWATFGQALNTGRIDAFCFGIWPNGLRARESDFTTPIYYETMNAYARANDTRFDNNLAAINDDKVTITTVDGEMSNAIAAADFPKAKLMSAPQMAGQSSLLMNLASGKGDVTFTDESTAEPFMQANPGKLKAIPGGQAIRVFGATMALPKNEYQLKAMLDTGTRELLQNGVIDHILDKYKDKTHTYKRVASPYKD